MVIKDETLSLINHNTGEIYQQIPGSDTYKIIELSIKEEEHMTEEQMKHVMMKFHSSYEFIKDYRCISRALYRTLSPTEMHVFEGLKYFISYGDNVLRDNGFTQGKPVGIKELAIALGKTEESIRNTMLSLKNKYIIAYHKPNEIDNPVKWISVNPYIISRGNMIEKWVIDYYKDSPWAKLKDSKVASVDD